MTDPRKDHRLRGLYAITDARISDPERLARDVRQALLGGARIIQYRDKSADRSRRLQSAQGLRKLTRRHGALLIINDDVILAAQSKADGVHIGRHDTGLADARARLGPQAIIGTSCYNQFELARRAAEAGADYIAFGRFFSSRTKPDAVPAGIELLRRAKRELDIPTVAIGGITATNAAPLVSAGADMLAVIDGLFAQPDIRATAGQFCRLFTHHRDRK